jgi:DNA-binding NtrC family response regulator
MDENVQKIIVVDDDRNMRVALFEALNRNGYEVTVAENGRMALDLIEKNPPDLVIADIKMPEMDGIELLGRIKALDSDLPVIIITGFATVDTAVEAMKLGAFDYILKPFPVEIIEEAVSRVAAARAPLAAAITTARAQGKTKRPVKPIIGLDPKLLRLMEKTRAVASSKATVLILGESGTGKEVFARFLHEESNRKDGPFVALNCAALPEGLLESELFGHEKGAFTGAVAAKKGKFEIAEGGTILLDEIGEIPLHLQAKLLRVLQEEEVDRLGGRAPVRVDVHVVATTNRDLEEAVREGAFRQDLFYRLNVVPLRLPALRERQGDIPILAEHFVEKYTTMYAKPVKSLSEAVQRRFLAHTWPGNVREMENLMERAVLLSTGNQLECWDFWEDEDAPSAEGQVPPGVMTAANQAAVGPAGSEMISLKEAERQMILQALQKTDNNRTHAARMLGISVRTLRNKLHEYRSQGLME